MLPPLCKCNLGFKVLLLHRLGLEKASHELCGICKPSSGAMALSARGLKSQLGQEGTFLRFYNVGKVDVGPRLGPIVPLASTI